MSETLTPVELTLRYATSVADLPSAWAFVMAHVDRVGESPSIEILPTWVISDGDDDGTRKFTVVVSGMVEEAP